MTAGSDLAGTLGMAARDVAGTRTHGVCTPGSGPRHPHELVARGPDRLSAIPAGNG
jgi:hypothetical protein